MKLPFTITEFLEVFKTYNNGVFPFQFVLLGLAVMAFFGILFKVNAISKGILYFLAFNWMWMGVVYHGFYFSMINKAAFVFGFFFIIQSLLFVIYNSGKNVEFKFKPNLRGIAAAVIILYALIIYPIISFYNGHTYPSMPIYSLPCPTTIFTFGILLLVKNKLPGYLLLIPFAWSLIGFAAALNLAMIEDFGLIISALISIVLIYYKDEKIKLSVPNREITIKPLS